MPTVLFILGLFLLIASVPALTSNWCAYRPKAIFARPMLLTLSLGVGLSALSTFAVWSYDENTRIVGFPFFAAAWQRHSAASPWLDFAGSLTFPMMTANYLFWLLVPQIALKLWRTRTD